MKRNRFTDGMGLRLSRQALRVLRERGIFAQSPVSLQHQQRTNRYVVRGLESGGAAGDLGRYVTFAQEDGRPIEYLHPVEAIGVNGLHAVVVAPVLVRLDMLRKGRTYEVLITRHGAGNADNGRRPPLETKVLFRGVHGRLELDLSTRDKAQAGAVVPIFYSLSGEEIAIPEQFRSAVCSIVKAANCSGCSHCHYVRARKKEEDRAAAIDFADPASPGAVTPAEHVSSREARPSAELFGEATGLPRWRERRRASMQGKLKKYALGFCLFVFLFVLIGRGLHLTSAAALIGALSGTPLLTYGFNRWCDAQFRGEEARREAPAPEIIPLREQP